MDDALLVGVLDPSQIWIMRGSCPRGGRSPAGDELPELVALEQLHHDEEVAVRLAEVVKWSTTFGWLSLAQACPSTENRPGARRVIGLGRDDLERTQPVERRVVGL